jgi:osmotically-inducible protein OsmY
MKSDAQIKKDVESELDWDPQVRSSRIGVAVKDGVVTLSGHLDSHAEKYAAERAAQRVMGVRAVAAEMEVRPPAGEQHTDTDIAAAAQSALRWHAQVPHERIKVLVDKGAITLSGEVDWDYERQAARKAVQSLTGVTGVNMAITLKPHVTPGNISALIQGALQRQAEREAKGIEVIVAGHTVTLKGRVHSWSERNAAQGAAWSAPGITQVINELTVA